MDPNRNSTNRNSQQQAYSDRPVAHDRGSDLLPPAPPEPTLAESLHRYEALVHSIDGIVWEADIATFQFTYVSPQAERILGYAIASWLEPGFWQARIHPVDRETIQTQCLSAIQALQNHNLEYRMVAADGRIVWLKDVVSVVVENGQAVSLRGIMLDITHQKQTEVDSHSQQVQLAMAFEIARIATWDWNVDLQQFKYSSGLPQLFGLLDPAALTFEAFLAQVHPDDRDRVQTTAQRSLQTGTTHQLEFRILWADGSSHWLSSHGHIFRDEDGNAQQIVGVVIDITQQKQAEVDLRQSHAFLQTVLDNLPVAVSVKDWRGDRLGTYTYWNRTCEQLFGITAEQALGKTAHECFSPAEAEILHHKDQDIFTRGLTESSLETPINLQHKGIRLLHTTKVPIFDEQHGPQYLLCISEDITDRQRAADRLRQQAEREALLAAITNDIRQSLNLKQILNTTVEEVRQFLQTDRVLIFRFRPSWSGVVLVESVAPGYTALLGQVLHDHCFSESFAQLYEQGRTRAISDVYAEAIAPCYLELLAKLQVRAILTVPIRQQGVLWGLLVAHHCQAPRPWPAHEVELLQQLSDQVGIAIAQSELYQQVQRLNTTLERQVQARTAELQLASEFEATLKRITDRVRDNLDEDQILQTGVQELATALGVTGCNAAIYDLERRTSKVSYEYTDSMVPLQGRVVHMDNFAEGYRQLLAGQYFQFCSLVPNPLRGYVSMLACPIFDDNGVLGDLWLVSQKYRAFNNQDIRLVQQVANQCAIAIRQARLFQKAQAQVQELEKLNRLKDDFLSTVSHELRTPMANIKMANQMLEVLLFQPALASHTPLPISVVQKAARYFQILKDECQREINLINDLLDLSRLETGGDRPTFDILNLRTWLPHLLQPFQERASNHQQTFHILMPEELPTLTTDPSRLERLFSELLNNACKYTPAGENIWLSIQICATPAPAPALSPLSPLPTPANQPPLPRHLTCVLTEPESLRSTAYPFVLQIQVSNSGVEVSATELTRIFEKFYRIPNNDPWKHGGTGLGLALVKKLLEPLGGSITATSVNGITQFLVHLPLAEYQ